MRACTWILSVSVALLLGGCPVGMSSLSTDAQPLPNNPEVGPPVPGSDTLVPLPTSNTTVVSNSGNRGVGLSAAGVFQLHLSNNFPTCEQVANVARFRQEILDLCNAARAAEGLGSLKQNQALENQATQYACELIHYDFFDHDNPFTGSDLADRTREFGYRYLVVGENLAAGQPTAEQAFQDWMDSPGHRKNIMDPRFTEIGIGIRSGGSYGMYWVQEFGRPADLPLEPQGQGRP